MATTYLSALHDCAVCGRTYGPAPAPETVYYNYTFYSPECELEYFTKENHDEETA